MLKNLKFFFLSFFLYYAFLRMERVIGLKLLDLCHPGKQLLFGW